MIREGANGREDCDNHKKVETIWLPATTSTIMLNFDTALDQKRGKVGWTIVPRDAQGATLGVWAGSESRVSDLEIEEALAIRNALIKARQEGCQRVVVQFDFNLTASK